MAATTTRVSLGNGAGDSVSTIGDGTFDTISLGNGTGHTVLLQGSHNTVTLGNGNGDVVNDSKEPTT